MLLDVIGHKIKAIIFGDVWALMLRHRRAGNELKAHIDLILALVSLGSKNCSYWRLSKRGPLDSAQYSVTQYILAWL